MIIPPCQGSTDVTSRFGPPAAEGQLDERQTPKRRWADVGWLDIQRSWISEAGRVASRLSEGNGGHPPAPLLDNGVTWQNRRPLICYYHCLYTCVIHDTHFVLEIGNRFMLLDVRGAGFEFK